MGTARKHGVHLSSKNDKRKSNKNKKQGKKRPTLNEHKKVTQEKIQKLANAMMDVEDPEKIIDGSGKKKKHNRRKITEEEGLDRKSTLETFKVEILKYYEKSGKLTELEKMDILPSGNSKLFFAKQNESLSNFLARTDTKLGSSESKFGLITVSQGALRCCDFKRELVPDNKKLSKKNVAIVKLFGKHLKIDKQVEWLAKKDKIPIAISTIDRLDKLFAKQAIDINKVDTVLLDWNYRNRKSKRLLDQPESMPLVSDFLTKLCFKQHNLKILFF